MKRASTALLLLLWATAAAAQNSGQKILRPTLRPTLRAELAPPAPVYDGNAPETQRRLQELLQQYPRSVGQVLALDPTLLSNRNYLEPYPALSAFLAEHPEIAHDPGFFLARFREDGVRRYDFNDPKNMAIRMVQEALFGVAFLIGFLAVIGTIAWLLRSVIEHRRWLRVSKTHTDTHTKLLDRLTSNEDLMAYMQSAAGRRFLDAAPIPLEAGPRALAAPLGRILWSVQAGVVVVFLGGGLMYTSTRFVNHAVFSDLELPLFVMGATAVAIGAGFVVSAIVAYGLSWRLGLITHAAPQPPDVPV